MSGRPTPQRLLLTCIAGLIVMSLLLEIGARLWVQQIEPTQLTWYDESVQLRMNDLESRPRDVDVLFVGSSIAWQGFVPSEFTSAHPEALTAYNAGLNGGIPVVVEQWLETIVPETSPETVVWGVSTLDFSSSYGDAAETAWSNALSTREGWLPGIDRVLSEQSVLLEWRRTIVDPSVWSAGDERDRSEDAFEVAESKLGPDGERLDFEVNFSDQRAAVQRARLADMTPDPTDIAAVLRAVHGLQEQGINVVLVKMPITGQLTEIHPMGSEDIQRIHSVIDEIAISLNIETIDLSSGLDDSQFVDLAHVNQAAAQMLSQQLAALLVEEGS